MDVTLPRESVINLIIDTNDVVIISSIKLHNLSDAEIRSVLENHTDLLPWQFGPISTSDEAREIFSMLDL